jgi:hypothetical protein
MSTEKTLEFDQLKAGEVLSETTYYVVRSINKVVREAVVTPIGGGKDVTIGDDYLENLIRSADYYTTEEKKSRTDVLAAITGHIGMACSIYFRKQDKPKTKKAFKADLEQWKEDAKAAFIANGISGLDSFATNPVRDVIPGEMRLIKGYYLGKLNEHGRLLVYDCEEPNPDRAIKQVDPRTVEYAIVDKVKHISNSK